jgi:hypothetical protein
MGSIRGALCKPARGFDSRRVHVRERKKQSESVETDTLETMKTNESGIQFSENVHRAINEWYQAELASIVARAAWQKAYAEGYAACEGSKSFALDPKGEAGRVAACELLQPMQETEALATAHACWVAKLTGVPFVILERPRK